MSVTPTALTATPGANGTASSASLKGVVAAPTSICTVDGIAGRLIYRGYSIEDLAQGATFEEVVYLLWEGELPTPPQIESFARRLASSRDVPPQVVDLLRPIPADPHPLAVLRSGISLLAHFDPQSEDMHPAARRAKAERLLGQVPTLVAARARLREGKQPVAPRQDLPAASNFLSMLWGEEPDELAAHAMDVALTLHAEHEFNASTFVDRVAASTYVDLHSALTAAVATLKGPRHGGANEDVIEMIEEIGTAERAEPWARDRLARYRAATSEERANPSLRFPGFGHAVYKTMDPRARHHLRRATRPSGTFVLAPRNHLSYAGQNEKERPPHEGARHHDDQGRQRSRRHPRPRGRSNARPVPH